MGKMEKVSLAVTLYGIPNCDTIKKAKTWLEHQHIEFTFHDFKKNGLDKKTIQAWLEHLAINEIINRKGTTWRALSTEQQAKADSLNSAIGLLIDFPSLVKRPVLQIQTSHGIDMAIGFKDTQYQSLFHISPSSNGINS